MTACPRDGCPGVVGRTGFCTHCGLEPPEDSGTVVVGGLPALIIPPPGERPTRVTSTMATRPQQTTGHGTGDEHVPLPVVALTDLTSRVLPDAGVPESQRYCGKHGCGVPVGRSLGGRPAPEEGYCPECGSPFSFSPKLAKGDLVAGRYDVRGCVARGGLGFVYLATDIRLGQPVALKGLIDTNNTAAVRIAENESQVLIALEHSNIVRILDVVTHSGASYIVMEFVDGLSLREVKNRGRASLDAPDGRLLAEHVVVYGREILTALSYLHGQGLLYCDMKPDNVIHGERRIKLIDFGAIRRIGDRESPWVGTEHYQIGPDELATRGLTVRSDIHTVGVTLRELFQASDGWSPTGEPHPAGFGIQSFEHVLSRATAPFDRRFASAGEMLVQLDGVLNEILSLRDRGSRPAFSTLFAEPAVLLDAGLGQPPPLEQWTTGVATQVGDRPTPPDIALGLPVPREDPDDARIAFLRTVRAPDAARLLKKLEKAGTSVEVEFRRCRALLELSDVDGAANRVRHAARLLGGRAPYDWRVFWHRGLIALAAGDVAEAAERFEAVYHDIPGEETPKLALGLCAEHLGKDAGRYYDALWVHRSQVNAAFGLARVALARGDRARAARVLDEVPEFSRYDEAARIAGIRVLAGPLPGGALPTGAEIGQAADRLSDLELDESGSARLRAEVLQSALKRARDLPPGPLLGGLPTEDGLRARLDETLRELAWQAPGPREHDVLTDLANEIRPVSWI